jgi:hypothetical protein
MAASGKRNDPETGEHEAMIAEGFSCYLLVVT